MKELRNETLFTVPRTLTSPRVPKKLTDSGHTTYVQPPFAGLFSSFALNTRSSFIASSKWMTSASIRMEIEVAVNCKQMPAARLAYCSSDIATLVMAVTPVRSVGWGSGSKRLVCGPGSSLPSAFAAASFAGSMPVTREASSTTRSNSARVRP